MGTRGLTVVIEGGRLRVAQYGQWDHYPEGQGRTCLEFLSEAGNVERLQRRVAWVRWIDPAELNRRWQSVGAKGEWATMAQSDAFKEKWPELSRDVGAGVLRIIADSTGVLSLSGTVEFAGESCCEWAWVVDLDERVLEAWSSYDSLPDKGSTRFDVLTEGKSAIHLVERFDLDALPSLKEFYIRCSDDQAKVGDIIEASASAQSENTTLA